MHSAAHWQLGGGSGVTNTLPLGEIMLTAVETAANSEGVPTNQAGWHTFLLTNMRMIIGFIGNNVKQLPGLYKTLRNCWFRKRQVSKWFQTASCLKTRSKASPTNVVDIAVPALVGTPWKVLRVNRPWRKEKLLWWMHPLTNISAYVRRHAALIKLAVTIFIEICFDT